MGMRCQSFGFTPNTFLMELPPEAEAPYFPSPLENCSLSAAFVACLAHYKSRREPGVEVHNFESGLSDTAVKLQ